MALQVTEPENIRSLMEKNGISNLNEFIALSDEEREELFVALKNGGVLLGDRSKLRRATADSIATWTTMYELDQNETQPAVLTPTSSMSSQAIEKNQKETLASKALGLLTKIFSWGDSSDDGNNSDTDFPTYSKKISGSPAWWKDHDRRMRKLALAMSDKSTKYLWQLQQTSPDYHQMLWERRAELLKADFAKDEEMRKEWLALILELDRTAGQNGPTVDQQQSTPKDYPWYEHVGKDHYKYILLRRRTELLDMNLTKNTDLQAEWVLLVRELESTIQTPPRKKPTSLPKIEIDGDAQNMEEVKELFKQKVAVSSNALTVPDVSERSISRWRDEVARNLETTESICSEMSNESEFRKADISRVASLASFYADSTRTEDFFTGSEQSVDLSNVEDEHLSNVVQGTVVMSDKADSDRTEKAKEK